LTILAAFGWSEATSALRLARAKAILERFRCELCLPRHAPAIVNQVQALARAGSELARGTVNTVDR